MINEIPVTDTNKKIKTVIKRLQQDGKWICDVPYGYIVSKRQDFEIVPTEAEIVRRILQPYEDCQSARRQGHPHPYMAERNRKEAAEGSGTRPSSPPGPSSRCMRFWDNNFYIGILRQGSTPGRRSTAKRSSRTSWSISSSNSTIRPASTAGPSLQQGHFEIPVLLPTTGDKRNTTMHMR